MAMTNRERQAKWRTKLKAMAEAAPRLEDLLRRHMRAFLLGQASSYNLTEEDREVFLEAIESLLSRGDAPLIEALNAMIKDLHEKEIISLFRAKRRETTAAARKKDR